MGGSAVTTALFRVKDLEPATGGCRNPSCEFAGIVTDPSIVAGIVFIRVGVLVGLAYVCTASESCRCERHRVLNERDAFEEFANRIKAIDPTPAESATATVGESSTRHHQTIRSGNPTDSTLRQVVSIYKKTVMSMAHYEAEYDETVLESMAAELGTDMATSLTTNGTLFSATQRALVDRANEAAAARTSLADAIETELNALCDAELELTAIDRRRRRLVHHLAEVEDDEIGAAIDVWHRLNDFETETEKVATERQRSLRNPPMRVNTAVVDTGEMEFYDYLYGATDGPRHPVLAQIVDLTVEIRDDRDYATTLIADSR